MASYLRIHNDLKNILIFKTFNFIKYFEVIILFLKLINLIMCLKKN